MKGTNTKSGIEKFMYYMAQIEGTPCLICLLKPICKKSFLDDSACNKFEKFINNYIEEKRLENKT